MDKQPPPCRWPIIGDFAGMVISAQSHPRCGKMELKMLECMEAYGYDRGSVKCKDLIEDYYECYQGIKQAARMQAMALERHRQYWSGERSRENRHAEPPAVDSFPNLF